MEFNYIYFISAQIQPCEGGGFWFAPKADSSDGNTEVCIVSHASKRQVLGTLSGRCSGAPTTRGFGASAAGGPDLHGTPDGSSRGRRSCQYQSNLEVRCIERKLKLLDKCIFFKSIK